MSQHQRILSEIATQYDAMSEFVTVLPSTLATKAFKAFSSGNEDTHIQYASIEHFKQMARDFLRKRKHPDSEENEAHVAQGDLDLGVTFSGKLQDRYPLPRKVGDEPVYKLRAHLTPTERAWNVEQLRKSGQARLEHARALEAEGGQIAETAQVA